MARRDGSPILLRGAAARPLPKVDFSAKVSDGGYDEEWIQNLLDRNPEVVPVEQIEPGWGSLVSVCRELPLSFGANKSGNLDNFFATAAGELVIVEAKLWRNPEARRSVVAQVMEYASTIFSLGYEALDQAVRKARKVTPGDGNSLFEIVRAHHPTLDEAEFIDAVSNRLMRGRAIVAVVGDGIREDLAPLANLLQSHAGLRFTFALIELGVHRLPDSADDLLVIPSVLAQTKLIERGVVRIEDHPTKGRLVVAPVSEAVSQPVSLGVDEFFEQLKMANPAYATDLQAFLSKAEGLGFFPDRQGGLNLKHASPDGRPFNLATITKGGIVDTGPSGWFGRHDVGSAYNRTLAKCIGATLKQNTNSKHFELRSADGKMPRLQQFLPQHGEEWLAAMQEYVAAATAQAEKVAPSE